jgi:hypothetical protein
MLAAALVLGRGASQAQPDPVGAGREAAAESLYEEGLRLKQAGEYLAAAEKLEQCQALDRGVGTLLHLGEAYEKGGRLASAWARYREAAALAREWGDQRRQKLGEEHAARIEPRLARLTIDIGTNATIAGLVVRRGELALDATLARTSLPLDAGRCRIEATAPGYRPFVREVPIVDGQAHVLAIPPLAPLPPPAAAAGPAESAKPPPATADATTAPHTDQAANGRGLRVSALALGLGSVVSTGAAIGLTVRALGLDAEADEHCLGTRCRDREGEALSRDAVRSANIATAGFVVAGAAGAGALTLLLVSLASGRMGGGEAAAPRGAVVLSPLILPQAGGLGLGGSF